MRATLAELLATWVLYMNTPAPEVMYRQNHSFAVDYYALGVIAYEFMLGKVTIQTNIEALFRKDKAGNTRVNSCQTSVNKTV